MKVIMLRSNIGQMRRKIRFQTYQCAYIHDKSKKEDKIMTSEHKNRAKTCKSDRDIEEEWNQLRRKTLKIPHKIPRAVNEVMKNTMRMRRLGLADIDDEHKVNLDLNIKEKYKKNDLDDSLKSNYPGNGRSSKTLRNPMSAKDKQFTNASTAPSHVRERQFLIPDEPDNAKALDVAVIGRPNAGKSSIMNFLLGANVRFVLYCLHIKHS
jgi:predicted GTPase